MPNRDDTSGVGAASARGDRDAPVTPPREGAEGPLSGDAGFLAEEARLNAELRRFDRERAGSPGAEHGHDQNYRPGYHEGGSRFGFFNGQEDGGKTPTEGEKAGDKS